MGTMKLLRALALAALLGLAIVLPRQALSADGKDDKGPDPQKMVFIHLAGKSGGGGKGKSVPLYAYIAKGFRWTTLGTFVVNCSGAPEALDASGAFDAIAAGFAEWETWGGDEIFGDIVSGEDAYDDSGPDGVNAVSFGSLPPGVIGQTVVWGVWWGKTSQRFIQEADVMLNTYYKWSISDAGDPDAMDVRNIATHEIGHCAGMDDLYTSAASLQTMYGYSDTGETMKRSLDSGDIAGIQALYQ